MLDYLQTLLLHDYTHVFVVSRETRTYSTLVCRGGGTTPLPPCGTYEAAVRHMAERHLLPEDREAFTAETELGLVMRKLDAGEDVSVRYRIRQGSDVRYRYLQFLSTGDGIGIIMALRDETALVMDRIRDAHELALGNSCIRFVVSNLCENFITVDVRTGLCTTVVAAGNGILEPQMSFRDQIRWFAENVVVPEERDAYRRYFELDALVAHIRESGGTASMFCTVTYADGMHELLIRSTLVRDTVDLRGEYVLLFAQDITSIRRMEEANRTLRVRSRRDRLTGLLNRETAEKAVAEYLRGCGPDDVYCFLLLDVDHFKGFNDRYGHITGDAVLRHMGRSMRRSFRSGDILCRWGGDEYVIFLCGTDDAAAIGRRIESLRARMGQCSVEGRSLSVTLSVGAVFGSGPGSLAELYRVADEALYKVKRQGRNGIVFNRLPPPPPEPVPSS